MSIEDTQSEIIGEFQNLVGNYYHGLKKHGFDMFELFDSFWGFNEQFGSAYHDEDNEDSAEQCQACLDEMNYCIQEIKEFIAESEIVEQDWDSILYGQMKDLPNTDLDLIVRMVLEYIKSENQVEYDSWNYSHITEHKDQVECWGTLVIHPEFDLYKIKKSINSTFDFMAVGRDVDYEVVDDVTTIVKIPDFLHQCNVDLNVYNEKLHIRFSVF